jgi:hypothetical protein
MKMSDVTFTKALLKDHGNFRLVDIIDGKPCLQGWEVNGIYDSGGEVCKVRYYEFSKKADNKNPEQLQLLQFKREFNKTNRRAVLVALDYGTISDVTPQIIKHIVAARYYKQIKPILKSFEEDDLRPK